MTIVYWPLIYRCCWPGAVCWFPPHADCWTYWYPFGWLPVIPIAVIPCDDVIVTVSIILMTFLWFGHLLLTIGGKMMVFYRYCYILGYSVHYYCDPVISSDKFCLLGSTIRDTICSYGADIIPFLYYSVIWWWGICSVWNCSIDLVPSISHSIIY